MIPEGWERTTLEEISDPRATIRYGVVQIGAHTPGGVPIVPIKYIDQIGKVPLHLASSKIEGKYKNSRVQAGDVLISVKGTIGEVGIVPPGFNGNIAREIARIRPNGKADAGYIAYQLQAPQTQRRIKSVTVGTTRLEFSIAAVKSFEIALPPLGEQRGIVAAVETWDRAIEAVEALIANARTQKQALMQQLLPQGTTPSKKRLPGFSGEWRRCSLGEVGTISSAGVDKKAVKGETEVRLLNFLDAYKREFVHNGDLKHVVTAPKAKVLGCNVLKGDVFFTPSSETRDDIALAAVAAEDMPGVVYSYHVVRLRPKQKLDLNFSAYIFQTEDFKRQAYRLGDGSGQRYVISQGNFRKMQISLPCLDEQAAIGGLLAKHTAAIAEYEAQLTALRQEKAALMQQLLTGKRRVKLSESEAV